MINERIIIILLLFTIVESADYGICGDLCEFKLERSTNELVFSGQMMTYDYNTTSERPWDSIKRRVKTIKIMGSIFYLGTRSFDSFVKLESVELGMTMITLGPLVFRDCISLKTIVLPETLKVINAYAFLGCSSLTSVVLFHDKIQMGYGTFWGCSQLMNVSYYGKNKPIYEEDNICSADYIGCGSSESLLNCSPFHCKTDNLTSASVPFIAAIKSDIGATVDAE